MAVAAAALALAVLHVLGGKLRFIRYIPRSGWLSFGGGISVAYVVLHLLPEVADGHAVLAEAVRIEALAEEAGWLVVLLGLALFYGVEVAARRSRDQVRGGRDTGEWVFWFSMASYALYNLLIGYLLHGRADTGGGPFALFVIAMGVHFVINDFALREHHKKSYERLGRWLLVGALFLGVMVGEVTDVREATVATVLAFIAGGVILNVLKEELPAEAESRLGPFLAGVAAYGLLLLAI